MNMLLETISEVQKTAIVYKDNQENIFLEKNRQVGMHTKNIDIHHHFLRDVLGEKYIYIKYIRIK